MQGFKHSFERSSHDVPTTQPSGVPSRRTLSNRHYLEQCRAALDLCGNIRAARKVHFELIGFGIEEALDFQCLRLAIQLDAVMARAAVAGTQ